MIKYLRHIFFPNVYVGVAFSEKDYLREMKRLKIESHSPFTVKSASANRFRNNIGETYIICYDPVKNKKVHKNQVAALIAHEAVHVSDWLFEHLGEDKPGMEIRAYLIQYIIQEALFAMDDFLKKKYKKNKA